METAFKQIHERFLASLMQASPYFPVKYVRSYLQETQALMNGIKDHLANTESASSVMTLLDNLKQQLHLFHGAKGLVLFRAILTTSSTLICQLLTELDQEKENLPTEGAAALLEHLNRLSSTIKDGHQVELQEALAEIASDRRCLHCVHSFVAHTTTEVILVIWQNGQFGDIKSVGSLPVVYVDVAKLVGGSRHRADDFDENDSAPPTTPPPRELNDQIQALFVAHSNLVAVKWHWSSEWVLQVVVPCKGFVPVQDVHPLPRSFHGYRVCVESGWVQYVSMRYF